MSKRISRKLLIGLGSVVTFGAVGTVSGFGVKSIIDSTLNQNQANQSIKSFPETNYTEMQNYNVATSDMFINTTDLSRFHFGNVQKGQTITPYGWIGLYWTERTNTFQNIALIGWNGEVIWSYDNTNGRDVYDVKYDYNTDLLFVLKTSSIIGVSNQGREPIELDVLEAKTGKRVDRVTEDEFKSMQTIVWDTLNSAWYNGTNLNDRNKLKNLMQIDLISKKGRSDEVVLNWMPNYMQLAGNSGGALPTLWSFRETISNLMRLIKFTKKSDQSGQWEHTKPVLDRNLLKQSYFGFGGGNYWQESSWDLDVKYLDNYTLITNPFLTINNDNSYVLHMLLASNGLRLSPGSGAKEDEKNGAVIIHKAVGITSGFGINKSISIFQQMGGTYKFTKSPFYKEYENWIYKMSVKNDSPWYKMHSIDAKSMTKANQRINRNMFDNNSIITPYRYSIFNKFPIYDVMQLNIDPATGKISFDTSSNNKKMTKRWSFGQDIVNYYEKNKKSYGANSAENSNVNRIFPYPDIDNKNLDVNHNYNRLISVSPFDNTFIYAAKPYLKYTQFNPDNNANNNKYAGFWVSSDQIRNNKPQIRPLIIVNDQAALNGSVDSRMTSIDAIYDDGFTFDPTSLYTSSDGRKHLNLYFNQNGTERNTTYTNSGMKSSKIGLLKDVLSVANREDNEYNGEWVWTTSIADKYFAPYSQWTLGISTTGISRSDFSTLIHSRADLTKWYTRTWNNLNFAGNLFGADQRINEGENSSSRAIAKTFGNKLDEAEFSSTKSVDLVSAWKDKADNGTLYANDPVNYNRLVVKRPIIKVGKVSSGQNSLPAITRYEMSAEAAKVVNEKPTWGLKTALGINDYNQSVMVLQKVQTINNVSVQIVSSWVNQYKMNTIKETTDKLASPSNVNWFQVSNPSWQDKITTPNLAFGSANNNVAKNNKTPLRLMLKLVKPNGTLPRWFGNNFDSYFEKAYPIEAVNSTETSFSQMVKEYANKKAQLIDLSESNNAAVSLGNLKIEAYLELNPAYNNSSTIYYNGDSSKRNIKRYLNDASGVIIYQDLSPDNTHLIYDQSQIQFVDFFKGAFGDSDQSPVRKSIINSWEPGAINRNIQIKVSTDYSQLPDTLVRKVAGDNSPLFSFDYKNGTTNQIEITPNPTDLAWFKNHFENYNRMLGLFVQFQYQLSGQTSWNNLGNRLNDAAIQKNFQSNQNKLVLSNAPSGIEKIRFKLEQDNLQDNNLAIDMLNFTNTESKYISAEHKVAYEKYIVQDNQIRSVWFANPNNIQDKFLNDITKNDIDQFIESVINKSTSSTAIKSKVTLKFDYNGKTNLDSTGLYNEIQTKLSKADPFVISGGNTPVNGEIIKAKFVVKDGTDSVRFFGTNGNQLNANELMATVVSNLITKIDLSTYINQITTSGLTVNRTPTTPGQFVTNGSDIQFPNNNSTSGFLAGMDFNNIKTKLLNVGVKIRYKGYDPTTGQFGSWQDNINSLRNYDPKNPAIKIGFQVTTGWNAKVFAGQLMNENDEKTIKLNLPKIITIDTNAVSTFQRDHGLGGNTKFLTFNATKITKLISDIKTAQVNNSIPDITNAPLEVLFQLGGSGNYETIEQLKNTLSAATSDKSSNLIKIKFRINPTANNQQDWILTNPDGEYTVLAANNPTVPIFVHDQNISEYIKTGTTVSGDNANLTINFPSNQGFTVDSNNNIKGSKGNGLKLQFSLNVNDDVNDDTKWTDVRPTSVPVGTKSIFVRIVPINNQYVYEKKVLNDYRKIQINFTIAQRLIVDKNWINEFQLGDGQIEIGSLTEEKINLWIQKIQNKVKQNNNNIEDAIAQKVTIKFIFKGKQNLTATQLFNEIKIAREAFSSNELGIVQLWNGTKGEKINAQFSATDNTVIIQDQNGQTNNLAADIATKNIYTEINLANYVNTLETQKTTVDRGNLPAGQLNTFTPPAMVAGATQFAGKTYDDISARLKQVGINILFKKPDNQWVEKSALKVYDPNTARLALAFVNEQNNNIKLKIKAQSIVEPGNDNKNNPVNLILSVPRQFNIDPNVVGNFRNDSGIDGDTKFIRLSDTKINNLINGLKAANQGSNNAQLEVMFRLGTSGNFELKDQFINNLKAATTDKTTNAIQIQFRINPADADNWFITSNQAGVYTILNDGNINVKFYINDQGIFNELKTTRLEGDNTNLRPVWPNGYTVDPTTGVLTIRPTKGVGLKLQFSFNNTLDPVNGQSGTDPQTQWTDRIPTTFDINKNQNLFIRLQVVNSTKYVYEKIPASANDKIALSLTNLLQKIKLDGQWLAKDFVNADTNLETLDISKFDQYEKLVKDAMVNLSQDVKDKIVIVYSFNNENNLTKNDLLTKIQNYKNNTTTADQDFKILKLWNKVNGQKITSTFAKKEPNGNYEFSYIDPNVTSYDLDTSKIITTIDFAQVLSWLQSLKVPFEQNQIKIPIVSVNNDLYFNGKAWNKVQQVLSDNFGITIEYRSLSQTNQNQPDQDWTTDLTTITSYDPAIGKFQIRFKVDGSKSKNIKFKTTQSETINGATANSKSISYDIKLAIKLIVKINQTFVNKFINNDQAISGDTKNLLINANLEQTMTDEIKQENTTNNNEFNSLKLLVKYQLGNPQPTAKWYTRDEFINFLKNETTDQTTNKVVFKFVISDDQNQQFGVDETNNYILSDFKPATAADIKIKYYINAGDWETKASRLEVSGTSDRLQWNFANIFQANNVVEKPDGKVYLRTNAGEAIQVYFTTKSDANYTNPAMSDQANEIESKWVSIKPTALKAGTQSLKIKLVAAANGYLYGPAQQGANPAASEHSVNINIQNVLYVDKTWLTPSLVNSELEISALKEQQHFVPWENEIYKKLAAKNAVAETIARKIKIKYFFEDEPNNKFSAADLINQITQLRTDYNNDQTLGIFQLWDGQRGKKIKAIFVSGDNKYILRVANNANNPTDDEITNQLDTSKIFTNISLVKYIETLTTDKTVVDLDENAGEGRITSFTPPAGKNQGEIFNGKSYDTIANRLNAIGVRIEFSKDKNTWLEKNQIKEYNIQTNALYLRFTLQSSSLKLQLNATTQISNGQTSSLEIKLPLQVPKYIVINNTKPYWKLTEQFNFRGTTKEIEFDENKIQELINEIKKDNVNAGNDQDYNKAPLEIQFQVGTGSTFTNVNELKKYLLSQTRDLPDRIVKFQFVLKQGTNDQEWKIKNPGEYPLLNEDAKNKIKIHINDNGVFNELSNMVINGTNDQLAWNWPNLVNINSSDGILNPNDVKYFGKGLKFEFTFKNNPDINGNLGQNPETDWVNQIPTSYDANKGFTKVYFRIKLTDANRYSYQYANQMISRPLDQVGQKITLEADWLNQLINNRQPLNLEQFNDQIIQQYETKVKEAAKAGGIADSLLSKFTIKYQFNFTNSIDQNQLVDRVGLLNKIQEYQNNNAQVPFGILQLWNNVSGIKIAAKFDDADPADKFTISVNGNPEYKVLNTENIITTIDFNAVLDWLKTLEVEIDEQQNNVITKLKIPSIKAGIPIFGSKNWTDVETTLASFGIVIQYSNNINGQQDNWGLITNVNKYDPKKPTFKIRFKLDGTKSKNIKFKVNNQEISGAQASETTPSVINIKARLLVEIPNNLLTDFINNANITGDTKNIKIEEALKAETNLINQMIEFNKQNDPRYANLQGQLELQYLLKKDAPTNGETNWKTLNEFKTYLASLNQDQTTNKIWFKIILKDKINFNINSVDEQPKVLSDHKAPNDAAIKIQYYVNPGDWETKANQLEISGTSDNLQWNFAKVFGNNKVTETANKVYLRNDAGDALQVYFTTKVDATYNDPQLSDDPNQINTHWVSIKPTAINAGTKNLKIKLVANTGYVYGPAQSGVTPSAQAHNVNINIQNVLYVNKDWFNQPLVNNQLDITSLNYPNHIKVWEDNVYQQLAAKNHVDDAIARKIKIKYFFSDEANNKMDGNQLIAKINQLRTDYNNQYLGIVQLWNGTQGRKLNAIFVEEDPKYTIRVEGTTGAPADNLIQAQINTNNIFTTISMVDYIEVLKREKTQVQLDEAAGLGSINNFNPPAGKTTPAGGIFDKKSYDQITQRLEGVGVKIEFAKEPNGPWKSKQQTKEYDIQKNSLYLRFRVESTNIKLQLNATIQIGQNQNSDQQMEIRLPLNVPKYIVIDNTKPYWQLTNQFNFSGTTKEINFDDGKITEFVNKIKEQNAIDGADESYKNAPLDIEFQVGTGSEFKEISLLKKYLKDHNEDMPDRQIKFKFSLKPGTDQTQWKIKNAGKYLLWADNSANNHLKIYINDKGVFNELKQMRITGSNDALDWNWPELVKPPVLNEITGILNPVANKTFGKGLKFEFTFNKNYANASVGTDAETQWVPGVPKAYDANKGFTDVYLRIKLTRDDYYTYDNANQTITLSLNQVGQKIILQTAWLEQQFNNGQELNLDGLTPTKIQEYETAVKQAAQNGGIDQSLLDKFTIKYQFNFTGNLDQNQLVSATDLIKEIEKYKTNNNQTSLGILQLWNQTTGVKIVAKFVDADENDKYSIAVANQPEYKEINTTNVITTIDFSKVISWLINTRKLVNVTGTATTATFIIPIVDIQDDPIFNGKDWTNVETALKLFGINSQYRKVLQNNLTPEQDWVDALSKVTEYNEKIGKIQIRLKFDNNKAKNIKLKTDSNKTYNGKNDQATSAFDLNLNIKLTLNINDAIVNSKFINKTDVISGNTKYLKINNTYEKEMIDELIKENVNNNAAFANSGLTVKYKLANQNQWKRLDQFIVDLKTSTKDETSNKVLFKFEVTNDTDFQVESKERTLFDPDSITDRDQWKVKLFINNADWEDQAANVEVGGKTSALKWNWNGLSVTENSDGTVSSSKGLEIQFSTKENASYNDNDVTNDPNDLKTKWITIKPIQIDPTTKNLWIRIKAKAGYVYGPAYNENGVTPSAQAHKVSLKIKREILVDPKQLLTSLSFDNLNRDVYVSDITTDVLNKFIEEGLDQIPEQALRKHVVVKFNFNSKRDLNADQLFKEIEAIINSNKPNDYGILQLWNGVQGTKIEAYYDLKVPDGEYELITNNSSNPKEPQTVVTSHIKTKINLIEIVNDFKTKKIEFEPVDNKNIRNLITIKKWKMPQTKSGSESLNDISWETFENRLKAVGVLIKARVVNSPDNNQDWKPLDQLKQYNDTTLQLALRFELEIKKADNIVLSVISDGDVSFDGNSQNSSEFKMNIKAPATVVVDQQLIQTFLSKDSFSGNTKILDIIDAPAKELIQNIIQQNVANNAEIFSKLTGRLEVQYYLGKNDPNQNTNTVWRTAEELKNFLDAQNIDQTTNQIWFRLNVKNNPNDQDEQIFQINQTAQILHQENISKNAKIKIYINETGFTAKIDTLKAVGSTDDFSITGIESWIKSIPKGLEIWYSNETDPNEDNDNDWTKTQPTTLNTDKKLWVRFKVLDGYVFENAKQNKPEYSEKKAINTDGIKVIIKLQTQWLEKIKITGNTKSATIDEQQVMTEIKNNNVLPTDQPDLIELQYNIKGTQEWLTKDLFTAKLLELSGSKDSQNFILRREDLQVRFNIKTKNNATDYGLNIDGTNVEDNNRNQFNVQIVDDKNSRNTDFKGYINLDKLTDFVINNFKIIGTTSKPKLIITNRDHMNTLFMPYATEGLFDIQFSTSLKPDGKWEWNDNKSILEKGQLIDQDGLINQHVQIGANKKFAIRFIAKNTKYDVYKADKLETDGYILDLSNNVKITIEITNPFTANDKTLGIWTRENNDGKYYQGQGGFKIVVANKKTLEVESNGNQSAQQFLESSQLQDNEKNALEFVYHIFGSSPSESEIKRVEKAIVNYDDETTWKSFEKAKTKNGDDWSGDLKLKVGDYVAVAIRVKKEFATQENPFILKDDDYSMILPVMNDESNQQKKPGRVAGYKVQTDQVKVEKGSVVVSNMLTFELPPLDGWTELQKLNLVQDKLGNYLGVNLKLEVYSTFHEDKFGKILKSGSGLKLVERKTSSDDSTITSSGNYKDASGQDIKDKNGQTIQIWKDNKKRLSAPKKSANVTKDRMLSSDGNGSFRLLPIVDKDERERFSLFRNQDVTLKLEANKGEGTDALPDFYLDSQDKRLEIKDEISPQIKFIVENEDKITYAWNYDEFLPDKIKYKAPGNNPNKKPEDGQAQIETIYQLIKKTGTDGKTETITGDTTDKASKNIQDQLDKDFEGQLKFQITYINKKGNQIQQDGNNIYQYQTLSNKDRIMLKIVAVDDDLFYVTDERPLIINVNGLTEAAPNADKLQHLRVKQGGIIDGQGSFKILVSDPNNPNEDDQSILKGWKFMVRVWHKDKTLNDQGKRKIKINWTDDQGLIKGLSNGDRVEWKLVSQEGNPVKEPYYNTIALAHDQKPDGSIKYNFAKVEYKNQNYQIVENGIGSYPENDDEYPENSGFVISGLKSKFEVFKINQDTFVNILKQLNPTYVGINTQGTINLDNKYFEDDYWVNTKGEIYLKNPKQVKLKSDNSIEELAELPIKDFLDHVTFYTHDPVIANYQGGFKFSGNDININNHLTNGDQMWATFDMTKANNDNSDFITNDPTSSLTTRLNDVSGLKDIIDPMSPLWYVLMALAGIATLGTAALIAFLVARHKKLKGKN